MASYQIPDLLRNWPWERRLSPHYEEVKQESSTWVTGLRPFSAKGQKAFDACDLNLLASLTYSRRDRDFVRAGCDLMNFYFVYDEYTDVCGPDVASQLAKMVLETMKYPHKTPSDHHPLSQMMREFWTRAQALAAPESGCFQHFIDASAGYLDAVTQEAQDRLTNTVRSIRDYVPLRRESCGGRPTLALLEFGLDLPNEVMEHPAIVALRDTAVDLILLVNDMHSYVREFSCGFADHNFISVIMNEYNIDRQSAFNWLGDYTDDVVAKFIAKMKEVPSWTPEIDDKVHEYINGLGQWVRGNDDWSCESKRYYGDDGPRVRELRVVWVCLTIGCCAEKDEVENKMIAPRRVTSGSTEHLRQFRVSTSSMERFVPASRPWTRRRDAALLGWHHVWSSSMDVLRKVGHRFALRLS